ncbi:MAG: hypothetical protein WC711_00755 [Candidatus Staskawiczbacteria bacterium]|jgi:hypothetical protein
METNKIIGYTLLIVGLLLIVLPLWQTYNIFTGKALPAQVFVQPEPSKSAQVAGPLDIQGQVQNAMLKVLPIDFINNTLNLTNWMLLLYILIYGGGKIADIGVKLIK